MEEKPRGRSSTFERSAEATWHGDVVRGAGSARAGTGAFDVAVTFPTLRGESAGTTTPEELLAASHATCYAIGLRSVMARRGGSAGNITVTATITAQKAAGAVRILGSHLKAVVEGVAALDAEALAACGDEARRECTISNALGEGIAITYEVTTR